MKMYCEHCQRIFADDDMKWKKGYYDYSYRTYPVCPFCSSEDIEEKEEDKYEEMFDEAMENAQLNWNKKYEEIKWRN